MLNKGKDSLVEFSKIPFIILEGKQYVREDRKIAWTKYVKDSIKTGKYHGNEFEETISIMEMLEANHYSAHQVVEFLEDQDYLVEELYHILKNLLLFYKDGIDIFREYFKGYTSIELEELIENIENTYKDNNQDRKAKVKIK